MTLPELSKELSIIISLPDRKSKDAQLQRLQAKLELIAWEKKQDLRTSHFTSSAVKGFY